MSNVARQQGPVIRTFTHADGYRSHYRLWGAPECGDVIVLLHGGMSHSGWQAPLGEALQSKASGLSFIALDRRGSGLNMESRGHMLSQEQVIGDVISFLGFLKPSFARVHLAGWCLGSQVASVVAAKVKDRGLVSSLILLAPGFFWNDRYSDVLRLSIQSVLEVIKDFNLEPEPDRAFIPLPLQTTDFTMNPEWQQFIADDQLRLTRVTKNTVVVSYEIQEQAREAISAIGSIPVLSVLGEQDKLVDNQKVRALLRQRTPHCVFECLDANHGVQFDRPHELAAMLSKFVVQASRSDR